MTDITHRGTFRSSSFGEVTALVVNDERLYVLPYFQYAYGLCISKVSQPGEGFSGTAGSVISRVNICAKTKNAGSRGI